MNYEEIYARLKAGEDSQTIAQEMADMLNNAMNKVSDEEKAASAAKAKADKKIAEFTKIWNDFSDWILEYYDNDSTLLEFVDKTTPEEIINDIEEASQVAKKMDDINSKFQKSMDAIDEFLKKNGLK